MEKEKIAILGGGVGGMIAALWLSEPEVSDRYDITVYQMGWRCGGKGASGRNLDDGFGKRSEEHGLHIWFGFYENAFKSMRKAYDEIGKHGPFNHWDDAFSPATEGTMGDLHGSKCDFWKFVFERESGTPGDGRPMPSLGEYVRRTIIWVVENIDKNPTLAGKLAKHGKPARPKVHGGWWGHVRANWIHFWDHILGTGALSLLQLPTFAHSALAIIQSLPVVGPEMDEFLVGVADELEKFLKSLKDLIIEETAADPDLRRLFIMLDLGATCALGALRDNVLKTGLDPLDEIDLCAWLKKHGAFYTTLQSSPMLKGLYDVPFAFADGDCSKPNFGTGTALRCLMKMMFGYKGAFVWKLQSGMGEIVFTPFYKALSDKTRGVKFKFFHKATALHLDAAGQKIESIDIDVQAKTTGDAEYDPLIDVNLKDDHGNPVKFQCWPDRPLAHQLATPVPAMDEASFESQFCTVPVAEKITLKAGVDFDKVITATSLHGLRTLAAEVIDKKPKWRAMIDNVKAIRTQCVQVWMKPTKEELGWDPRGEFKEHALVDAYYDDINTWMDEAVILKTEEWPASADAPHHLVYFCGPMKNDSNEPPLTSPPATLTKYPATQEEKVYTDAMPWLDAHTAPMWPRAVCGTPPQFEWDKAFDPKNRAGKARSEGQYYRANIDPQERYVLTVAGSTKYRLKSDNSPAGSDVTNLFLAGDWTHNGLNVGAVESATLSGMQASRAICGLPKIIPGEKDL